MSSIPGVPLSPGPATHTPRSLSKDPVRYRNLDPDLRRLHSPSFFPRNPKEKGRRDFVRGVKKCQDRRVCVPNLVWNDLEDACHFDG